MKAQHDLPRGDNAKKTLLCEEGEGEGERGRERERGYVREDVRDVVVDPSCNEE